MGLIGYYYVCFNLTREMNSSYSFKQALADLSMALFFIIIRTYAVVPDSTLGTGFNLA